MFPAERVDLPPGQIIRGTRYRVLAKIGEGGVGAVYMAEHVDLEKKVAIKILLGRKASSPTAIERFRQEARAASKIGNAFICDVTDFGQLADGQVFFVMEFLDGQSLRDLIAEEGALAAPRTVAILRQITKALSATHEKGIIHLDVKPDNVMLVRRGRREDAVKMVDFGIARLTGNPQESGEFSAQKPEQKIEGTPGYLAPERIRGHGYDHRTDIYSLGVLAYEMLTGTLPFREDDVQAVLTSHVVDRPEPMRQRAPDRQIPADLEAMVMQMLHKDPGARPQGMAVVEAMLCEVQIAGGFSTDWDDLEIPPVDEVWQKKLAEQMPSVRGQRFKRVAILGSAVAVACAAVAIYFGVYAGKEKLVPFEVTRTEEDVKVKPWLEAANSAMLAGRFVRPEEDCAYAFIVTAEQEAEKAKRPSPGAQLLRQTSAGALAGVGNELLKVGLRDLATVKFQEALRFLPDDADLQRKAELPRNEIRQPKAHGIAISPARQEVLRAAADLWEAARSRQLSLARLHIKELVNLDRGGQQVARMSDALRGLAQQKWTTGHQDDAQFYYQLIADLDPLDETARQRIHSADPVPGSGPGVISAVTADGVIKAKPASEESEPARGDRGASQRAVNEGEAALGLGQLSVADAAFSRAVRSDSTNPAAVGGVAAVAFEQARYIEAMDYARRATRLAPRSARYWTILGDSYFKLLRYDQAQGAYNHAAALLPNDDGVKSRLDRTRAKLAH